MNVHSLSPKNRYTARFVAFVMCLWALSIFLHGQAQSPESNKATLTIQADQPKGAINRNIYGQFAEHLGRLIYEGIWVGEDSPIPNTRGYRNDVLAALKELRIPVVRWPGGCFADEYHWRDGVGPRDKRPRRPNASWGGVDALVITRVMEQQRRGNPGDIIRARLAAIEGDARIQLSAQPDSHLIHHPAAKAEPDRAEFAG